MTLGRPVLVLFQTNHFPEKTEAETDGLGAQKQVCQPKPRVSPLLGGSPSHAHDDAQAAPGGWVAEAWGTQACPLSARPVLSPPLLRAERHSKVWLT